MSSVSSESEADESASVPLESETDESVQPQSPQLVLCHDETDIYSNFLSSNRHICQMSIFSDISIKVESDIFQLNRALLAVKSDYFEKMFIQDFSEKTCDEIEIHTITSDTFSNIVDIIYGKELKSVVNETNFVALLKALNYLQMEIDLDVFLNIIRELPRSVLHADILHLHDVYDVFAYLSPSINEHISHHLMEAYKKPEFVFTTCSQLIDILHIRVEDEIRDLEKRFIHRICAKWICHDVDGRLHNIVKLVNAVKSRHGFPHHLDDAKVKIRLPRGNETEEMDEVVAGYFYELMYYYGGHLLWNMTNKSEPSIAEVSSDSPVINKIDIPAKWEMLKQKEVLCDVSIKIDENIHNLHRIVLAAASPHFLNLFVDSHLSKGDEENEIFVLDGKLAQSFTPLIKYIYNKSYTTTSQLEIIRLFEASIELQMDQLHDNCYKWIKDHISEISEGIFDLFQLVNKIERYAEVHDELIERIFTLWPKISETSNTKFEEMPFYALKALLNSKNVCFNNTSHILELCSLWIMYDVPNRHPYLARLAQAINRNFQMDCEQLQMQLPTCDEHTSESIKEQFMKILTASVLVPLSACSTVKRENKPHFIAYDETCIKILDVNLQEIHRVAPLINDDILDMSAAMINDNLFILYEVSTERHFQVFNTISGELTSLASHPNINEHRYYILNCQNEIYCAEAEGELWWYSIKFNTWICLDCTDSKYTSSFWFASDGKKLYSIGQVKNASIEHGKEEYYVHSIKPQQEKCEWNRDLIDPYVEKCEPLAVNFINEELSVMYTNYTCVLDHYSLKWTKIHHDSTLPEICTFTQYKRDFLYLSKVDDNQEVHLFKPVHNTWQLISSSKDHSSSAIVAIHIVDD